jgi:hypothetical protein
LKDWLIIFPASQIGDTSLIVGALIATTVLQRVQTVPEMVYNPIYQSSAIALAIAWPATWICLVLFYGRRETVLDSYHHIVVFPLLAYTFLTLWPVVYYCGSKFEWRFYFFLHLSWFSLVIYDGATGRLQQTKYVCWWIKERSADFLKKHGEWQIK